MNPPRYVLTLIALTLIAASSDDARALDMPVRTTAGAVSGVQAASNIAAFKGIPFAAPPLGSLRWRAPQTAVRWKGVRKAVEMAPACAQAQRPEKPLRTTPTSEDCLYLNVWTPAATSRAKLPVLVWIYGGGFQWGYAGDSRFDGENLARKGVVLVTIAYRVGALGFLAHPDLTRESAHHASGNYGILDQIAALSWIQHNIVSFGGDPSNVTIFGQSAGSTAINILQASPLAKGLFRRAIGESTSEMDAATGLPGRQSLAQAEQAGVQYQTAVGATSLAELRALPADKLTASQFMFWPIERDGYVLPRTVYATFAGGHQNAADLLVGANADEGAVLRMNWIKPETQEQKTTLLGLYGQENPTDRQSDTDTVLWQMWSWAKFNARTPGHRSFVYWFNQTPPPPPASEPWRLPGPIHGAEIPYVFDNLKQADVPWTDTDRNLAETMSTYWTNFAKSGDPNGAGLPEWPAFDASEPRVLEFAGRSTAIALPRQTNIRFIDAYFTYTRSRAENSSSPTP